MSRHFSRLAAPLLAFSLLASAAQAFPGSVNLPNLTFAETATTLSTKSCQTDRDSCPTER